MYYAACCCRPPGVACECGEPTYASLTFNVSSRSVEIDTSTPFCITYCTGAETYGNFLQSEKYAQCKVYMKCEYTGNDGRVLYTSGAVDPTRQKFDEGSLAILSGKTSSSIRERSYKFRGTTNEGCINEGIVENCCCHPGAFCCQPGSYQTTKGNSELILPFDPYDLDPGQYVSPSARTEVLRGIYIPGSTYQGVPIDDDLWYRITEAGMGWNIPNQRNTWQIQSWPQPCYPPNNYNNTYFQNSQSSLSTGAFYLIGEECDPHAPGELLASWPSYEDVLVDGQGDAGCGNPPGNNDCPPCCRDLDIPYDEPQCEHPDEGGRPYSIFWANYGQGGVSGLEFSDEPSPYLP